jgi:hypothetical protein
LVNHTASISDLCGVPRLLTGLAILWRARPLGSQNTEHGAKKVVTGSALCAAGLTRADVELLVTEGCANVTSRNSRRKIATRRPREEDVLSDHAHFVLTESGEALVERFLHVLGEFNFRADQPKRRLDTRRHVLIQPHWDGRRRELRFGRIIVKRFRNTAPNQESILSAFEASGWPDDIDDPLPAPRSGGGSAPRLQHTIRRLNQTLQHPLIRFEGDAKSGRVGWRYVGQSSESRSMREDWGLLIG